MEELELKSATFFLNFGRRGELIGEARSASSRHRSSHTCECASDATNARALSCSHLIGEGEDTKGTLEGRAYGSVDSGIRYSISSHRDSA